MATLELYDDRDYVPVTDLFKYEAFVSEEVFRDQIAFGNTLSWNRAGEWRHFPNAILVDVLHSYDMWKNAPKTWTVKPPATVGKLFWDQGLALDQLGDKQPRVSSKANDGSN